MAIFKARTDSNQKTYRTRSSSVAARTPKGHPLRQARRERAKLRLAAHIYDPTRCKPGCPKRNTSK